MNIVIIITTFWKLYVQTKLNQLQRIKKVQYAYFIINYEWNF